MKRLIAICAVVLTVFLGMSARVQANDIVLVQTNLNTDFTVAGVGGLRDVGSGVITVTNIHGPVTSAYLYWHGPMNSTDPNANAAVFVDGQAVTGVNIGFSAPNCWPSLALSQAYRADVTALVAAKGNGAYQLTGFLKPGNINANGASLIAFFHDTDPDNNRDVVLFHGNDSNFHNSYDADNWNVFLSGINYTNSGNNSRAFIQLHVADGQVFDTFDDDALRINGTIVAPAGLVFSGDSVPSANDGPRHNGNLWDIKTWEITSLLTLGLNSLSVSMGYVEGGDCLSLVLAVVDLPVGAIAIKPDCTLVCSSDVVANNATDQCGATVNYPLPTKSGTCTDNVVCVPPPGSLFPVGTTVVNCSTPQANCSFRVVIQDTQKPVFDAVADLTRSSDPGVCSAVVNYTVTARDNCPGAIFSCVPTSGAAFPVGVTTVTCTATDASKNKNTTTFKVTITDNQAPTITQPADIARSPDAGKTTAMVTFPLPSAQDNCPGVVVVCAPPSGSTFPMGVTTVTCTATDTSNNKGTTTFKVTVKDGEPPQIVCPADILKNNDLGLCSAVVTFTVTAMDNTPGVTSACVPASGSAFPVGMTTVNCTATDTANNKSSCSFKVTVVDAEKPTIVQPSDIVRGPDAGKNTAVVTFPLPVAQDNCPGVTVACVPASGSTFAMGVATVNCTATDTANNKSTTAFKVTIKDADTPQIVCPLDILKNNDLGLCSAVVNFTATATDNTPGVTVGCLPASSSVFPVGVTTVNCTATDSSGNQATCSFHVTVADGEKPSLAQPADIVKNVDPGLNTAVVAFPLPAAQDNCPGVTVACAPASGATFPLGATTVTCTATDKSNNKTNVTFKVTVKDGEPPAIVCPADLLRTNDLGLCSAVVNFTVTATDNTPGVTVACVPATGSSFPVGVTTVNCTATDTSDNKATCSFRVTVVDAEKPTLAQPVDIVKNTDAGKNTALVTYPLPVAQDNCPGVTVACAPASGATFPLGVSTVTCAATDRTNNQSTPTTFKVTVRDLEPPQIVCPADIVKANDPGLCSAVVSFTVAATDNAPGLTVACVPSSGSVFPVGATTVNCVATDSSGNKSSCAFQVTIRDNEKPTIVCPASMTVNNEPGQLTAVVTFPAPTASDNCPGVTVACVPASGSAFPIGVNPVTCTATDAAGNTSSCSFEIRVLTKAGGVGLTKTVDKAVVSPGEPVIYSYVATNTGATVLTGVVITDDNGTPGYLGDDFVVATNVTLAPFQSMSFTKTVVPPVNLVSAKTGTPLGWTTAEVLPNGDIKATLVVDASLNDNSYGANASTSWGKRGHKLNDLAGGDNATFSFQDTAGKPVLAFRLDYLSASRTYPSGFGTLGVTGGDGGMLVGKAADVVAVSTSLSSQLNSDPFVRDAKNYTVSSPAPADPNALLWENRVVYTVVVRGSAFGIAKFGSVIVNETRNTPAKTGPDAVTPQPVDSSAMTTAVALAQSGNQTFTTSAQAAVKISLNIARCPLNYGGWKKEAMNGGWTPTGYLPNQLLGTVFSPLPTEAASMTLLRALEGKAGTANADNLLKQGVAALLNASHPAIGGQYAFTRTQVINLINAALASGNNKLIDDLTKKFYEANKNCQPTPPTSGCGTCNVTYPYASTNPRTSIVFNESDVLRGYNGNVMHAGDTLKVWYNDEHALVLGVRQVVVKDRNGFTTNNYPVAPLPVSPSTAPNPAVGSTALLGDQAGTDISERPMFPALFITDLTQDPDNRSGDWQFGGTAIPPHAIFGSWKGAVRHVDNTVTPALITVDPDSDPAKNNWNLAGGGPVPTTLKDAGYGAEVQWNLANLRLISGHTYRFYFMVHDGDQNKVGGDSGHGCVTVCFEP